MLWLTPEHQEALSLHMEENMTEITKQQIVDGLILAKALISDPTKWQRGSFGRSPENDGMSRREIRNASPEEIGTMCTVCALDRVAGDNQKLWQGMAKVLTGMEVDINWPSEVCQFNNGNMNDKTHSQLMTDFDAAINQINEVVAV